LSACASRWQADRIVQATAVRVRAVMIGFLNLLFPMLRYALIFLIVAIIAAALGFGGIAGTAGSIAKILFYIFLVLFVLALIFGRRGPPAV
jgi:uncharacterized membrane protein YtjA (UPF0391 family)